MLNSIECVTNWGHYLNDVFNGERASSPFCPDASAHRLGNPGSNINFGGITPVLLHTQFNTIHDLWHTGQHGKK